MRDAIRKWGHIVIRVFLFASAVVAQSMGTLTGTVQNNRYLELMGR